MVFFRDYGRLLVAKKKKAREKPLDIWYCINCEIITQEWRDIHTIGNIHVTSQFSYEKKSFHEIQSYLELLHLIKTQIPSGTSHWEIYNIIESITQRSEGLSEVSLLLTHLKILLVLGNISTEHTDETIQKILLFLNSHKISDIMKLTWVTPQIQQELQKLI